MFDDLFKIAIMAFITCGLSLVGAIPVTPDNVLAAGEVKKIHDSQNYFDVSHMDDTSPTWVKTNRQYSSHLLKSRTSYIGLKQAVTHVLSEGFPVQRRIEELYRARMGIHSRIGNVLPQLKINFNRNPDGVVSEAFSGLLGFLSPANWMAVANQKRVYRATKYLLIKDVMDEVLKAKLAYLDQHQRISDFEILNFYFIHLQVLAQKFDQDSRGLQTLMAEFASEGTNMASQRGSIKLGFDDLALTIALEKIGDQYSVDKLNINDLPEFPEIVKDLDDVPRAYRNKEEFLTQVITKSVELKAIKEFLKVSKLNIGITAAGSLVDNKSSVVNNKGIGAAIKLGYGTLPNILIAKSFKNTAKIDVRSNYLSMLDHARRSFDFYTNSLGGFTEARRSIRLNRAAFKKNLQHIIENNTEPDALFFLSLHQLIHTELKLNNALHGSLKARAWMNRYLLVDDLDALEYLPSKEKIISYFNEVKREQEESNFNGKQLDRIFKKIHSKKKLENLLSGTHIDFSKEEINQAILRNQDKLAKQNFWHRKHRGFFTLLYDYMLEQNLETSSKLETRVYGKNEFLR